MATSTSILDGFDWVIGHAIRPAVIMFDLDDFCVLPDGGPVLRRRRRPELDRREEAAYAAGILVVTGAGDPASTPAASRAARHRTPSTVGANHARDVKRTSRTGGPCLTMWAPVTQSSPTRPPAPQWCA
jgi:hypothetical protein